MNNLGKITIRLEVIITRIFALILLTACTTASATALGANTATTLSNICHATGDPANPYEEIVLANDIYPAPVNGCPASAAVISNGKITICHATGNKTNPYEEITVSANGLDGHGTHEGDIITSPEDGCPKSFGALYRNTDGTTSICHATGDAAKPYEEIAVTDAELAAHLAHPNDLNPMPDNGCPATLAVISNGKIAICHATNSQKNPYNEITVSVNGLNGHGKHQGDIIPAPAGGCPTTGGNKSNGNGSGNNGNGNGSGKP